jgi:hypothetical protein
MDIFESLENINISEECFNSIMSIVEEYINELDDETVDKLLRNRAYQYGKAAITNSKDHDELKKKFFRTKDLVYRRNERKKPEEREYEGDIFTRYTKAFNDGCYKGEDESYRTPKYVVKKSK